MKARIGKLVACTAILAGLSGPGTSTAKAGITLVITVSDANGTATGTYTSATNSYTYNNTGFSVNAVTGNAAVFNDFSINTTGSTDSPGVNGDPSFTTDNSTTVDYKGATGTTGTLSISVYPTDFTAPGTTGTPLTIESEISTSTNTKRFNSLNFTTYLAQSSGTFTPGFQSIPPGTSQNSSDIYTTFVRSGPTFRLYNTTSYVLPGDPSSNHPISTTGTSTVTADPADDLNPGSTLTVAIVTPEPATLVMSIAGLPVLCLMAWRRRRATKAA